MEEIITGFVELSGRVKSLDNVNLILNQRSKEVKLQLDNEGLQSDFNKLQNSEKPVSLVEIEEELCVLTHLKLKFTKMKILL